MLDILFAKMSSRVFQKRRNWLKNMTKRGQMELRSRLPVLKRRLRFLSDNQNWNRVSVATLRKLDRLNSIFLSSEESKTEVNPQRLGYSPPFRKKYPRASLQSGQFLRGSTFSSAFVKDASILDLFSSSVNKFIPKFPKLLPFSTPGWTFPPFPPKRLRGNYW